MAICKNWIIYWIESPKLFLNWIIVWTEFWLTNFEWNIELNPSSNFELNCFGYHGLSVCRYPGQYSIIHSFTFYLRKYVILRNPPVRQSLGWLRDSDSPLGPQPARFRFFFFKFREIANISFSLKLWHHDFYQTQVPSFPTHPVIQAMIDLVLDDEDWRCQLWAWHYCWY